MIFVISQRMQKNVGRMQGKVLLAALVLIGAGCTTGVPTTGSVSNDLLPETFYGYMHWTHEDPGQTTLAWTAGFEADVVLEFSGSGNGRWEVEGSVVGNPATYTCSGSSPQVECDLTRISNGLIAGEAYETDGQLAMELSWHGGVYPVETGVVTVPGPLSPITSQSDLAVLNTDLVSEFIGSQWSVYLVDAVFLDDAAILASDLSAGTYSDVDLTYGLPPTDSVVRDWQAKVAARTFASSQPFYGDGHGTFYLFSGHPEQTVLR